MNAKTQRRQERAEKTYCSFTFFGLLVFLCVSAPLRSFAEPATTQSAKVSADAAKVIADVKQAYAQVASLNQTGTITGDFDVDGQKETHALEFTSSYSAPNLFKLETKDDATVGSTGQRMYVYAKPRNIFLAVDAPHEKTAMSDLPDPFGDLISSQDPSLTLALSPDPAAELQRDAASIEKLADVKIDERIFTAIKLDQPEQKRTTTLLIDPKSHLIRRAAIDLTSQLASRGALDIKKATITIDYNEISSGATTKPAQFAWAPPPGARDAQDMVDAGDASHLVGKTAPAFTLKDLGDKDVSLRDLKGNVIVLDFWATWCGPCVMSLPKLDRIYQDLKDQGVKVYAVNQGEDKELVGGFMGSRGLVVPVLLDSDAKVGNQYDVNGIPQTVVIDKSGVIRNVFVGAGPDSENKLREAIQQAMHASK